MPFFSALFENRKVHMCTDKYQKEREKYKSGERYDRLERLFSEVEEDGDRERTLCSIYD